ncbi:hypothetical protein JKP88DRAFT_244839 [Tribonema minus]|uniref:Uncharacterized protein n=1 Tax=Tribonema minus TaxID=303371 RepID=A0A835Z1L7_9STRA|nr:hypothetical protein JKP88DRAFT_244839 [Tribonema minus]
MALRNDAMRTYQHLNMRSGDRTVIPDARYQDADPDDGPDADADALTDANTFNLIYSDHYSKNEHLPETPMQTHAKSYKPRRRTSPSHRRHSSNTRECPLSLMYGDSQPRGIDAPNAVGGMTHALPMQPAYDYDLNDMYETPRDHSEDPANGNNRYDIAENWAYTQNLRPRVDIEQAAQDRALLEFKEAYDRVYQENQSVNKEAVRVTTGDDYMNDVTESERPYVLDASQHYF